MCPRCGSTDVNVIFGVSDLAHRTARAVRQRANDHSLWPAGATSIVGKDFLPAIAPKSPLLGRAMGVLQMPR
jgi:hypothetical protein